MGLFSKLSKFLSSPSSDDEGACWVYVCCNRCGEQLRSRVNLYNDLSIDYQGRNEQTYICRKTLVGNQKCFQRIEIELKFDEKRNLLEREISGGEFIEAEDYSVGEDST